MFAGRVVSRLSPTTLVVNVGNPAGDATLKFANAVKGIDAGTLVYFNGIVDSCVKEPFMLTLRADDFVMPADVSPPRARPGSWDVSASRNGPAPHTGAAHGRSL